MGIDEETLWAAIRKELGPDILLEGRTLGWEEAAKIFGCTEGTLKVWVSQRKVPFTKVNNLTRFRPQDLRKFLEQNSVPASAA